MNQEQNKRKKLFSIIFLSAFALIFIITLIFFVDWDGVSESTEAEGEKTEQVADKDTSKKDKKSSEEDDDYGFIDVEATEEDGPLAMTKEVITYLYRENIAPIGEGEEYPLEQTASLKRQLLNLAQDSDYQEILDILDPLLDKYTFSKDENLDIAGIYHDVVIMMDFMNEEDRFKFGDMIATSKTPEMLVANTLFSDNFARRQIIEDWTSIAPIGYDHFIMSEPRLFRNVEQAEDEQLFNHKNIVREIFTVHDQVNSVYAFDITIPQLDNGLPLTAYVWEDLFGNISYYGMYVPDDFKTYEQPLTFWAEQDYLYDIAEENLDKYYEDLAEKGIITNEQIEMWFESGY